MFLPIIVTLPHTILTLPPASFLLFTFFFSPVCRIDRNFHGSDDKFRPYSIPHSAFHILTPPTIRMSYLLKAFTKSLSTTIFPFAISTPHQTYISSIPTTSRTLHPIPSHPLLFLQSLHPTTPRKQKRETHETHTCSGSQDEVTLGARKVG